MFTGIVEEIGTVLEIRRNTHSSQLKIACSKVLTDVHKGDSIAVSGVCLTVAQYTQNYFMVDVMPETVSATTLHSVSIGDHVNLERAMAANGRFGGHFVSGHVDATGTILSVKTKENAIYMEIGIAPGLLKYFMPKGSVTIDGTSLTVFDVTAKGFVISLIPVTQEDSIIGNKKVGAQVNVECDMLAKYLERLITSNEEKPSRGVTMNQLAKNGFLD